MALALFQNVEAENNASRLELAGSIRAEQGSALPLDAIETAVLDLRRKWRLTLSETCVLHQAALGRSDDIVSERLNRAPSTLRNSWRSIREKSGYKDHRRAVFDVWQLADRIR